MAFALFASVALATAPQIEAAPARATARATVQILPGERVHLGPSSTVPMVKTTVRIEDGQRRPAYLIEFE